jgi:hypothetical protein
VTIAALSSACTQKWYLSILSAANGIPEFCFSDTSWCGGRGHHLPLISVTEVDAQGHPIAVVWSLQGHSDAPQDYVINKFRYGTLPHGWVELSSSTPLREHVYYSVLGEFYFVLLGEGKSRVYLREEFSKMARESH